MIQPSARTSSKPKKKTRKPRTKPKFGTSKLEVDFAKNFLDKLGVKYVWQFEAKSIKRFFDYYLPEHNLIIEVDGGYFHSDPRIVEESKMNPMQKHNKRVDGLKEQWAAMNGIPVMRIWEKDIRENPASVMKMLKKRLSTAKDAVDKKKEKNKRH